jgi:hypothetical protein
MAKKISLWISTLFTPVTKSPLLDKSEDQATEVESEFGSSRSLPWTVSDQETDTLVNTSPDMERRPARKESVGGGIIVREQLIRDLE